MANHTYFCQGTTEAIKADRNGDFEELIKDKMKYCSHVIFDIHY